MVASRSIPARLPQLCCGRGLRRRPTDPTAHRRRRDHAATSPPPVEGHRPGRTGDGKAENDRAFSKRLLDITRITDGPVGVGTVYRSKAKDLGRTAVHDIEITAFDRPTTIRWREISKGPVVIVDGGYTLRDLGGSTELTFHGDLEGRGPGKLIEAFVSSRVRAGFPDFADAISLAVETHT